MRKRVLSKEERNQAEYQSFCSQKLGVRQWSCTYLGDSRLENKTIRECGAKTAFIQLVGMRIETTIIENTMEVHLKT